uniref:Transporter n=1 Tax=Anolis carolinensis TaxID=28377 RepID=A0A803TQ89_ANOCA
MEKSKADLESDVIPDVESNQDLLSEESTARPAWGSKVQYILAQVGFSVGLGNVWRFPYLCHQNGGGAFLLLYLLLLLIIGIPLFFLELAAGQSIRQGSIGVWKYISPRLMGIGFASCVVCSFVALYYNVIIAWSLFYLGNSFQSPLPWNDCPETVNQTISETECEDSSATVYFWYRKALHVSDSIEESGGLDPALTGCLFAAWALVCLAMIKGIKSSGKVLYFSSLFPYVVLFCFLIRALLLEGAADGIRIMFTPNLSIWGDMQVWRQAATQVFFALGLGFGTIIAYSSYNRQDNNCHFDGLLVAFINFLTSILATLVVFAVLGFRANIITQNCAERSVTIFHVDPQASFLLPILNGGFWESPQQVQTDLKLLFTSVSNLIYFSILAVLCCIIGFLLGLVFVQHSGNYFVTMFDDYSATLPLLVVVAFEAFAVAWIYGADRFLNDIEKMLGWRPWRIYKYMWRFVSLGAMLCLLLASLLRMILKRPTYQAWNREKAEEQQLEYPPWALGVLVGLIVVAALPIPVMFLRQLLIERFPGHSRGTGVAVPTEEEEETEEKESPADPDPRGNGYVLVQAEDGQD